MPFNSYRVMPGLIGLLAGGVSLFYQNLPATFISLASGLSASWLTTERRLKRSTQSNDEIKESFNLISQQKEDLKNKNESVLKSAQKLQHKLKLVIKSRQDLQLEKELLIQSQKNLEYNLKFLVKLILEIKREKEYLIQSYQENLEKLLNDKKIEILHNHAIREAFLDMFNHAEKRIIIVCPWIGSAGVNSDLIYSMKRFLEQDKERKILIAYGHHSDIRGNVNQQEVDRLAALKRRWKYGKVKELAVLAQKYTGQLMLRIMTTNNKAGTHEKFVICDDKYAILGSYNFLTSRRFSGNEIAIKTSYSECVTGLVEHFNKAAIIRAHPTINPDEELAIQQKIKVMY